jgi:two-component system, chemotaxis family, protein-glutamate methylesterase/glutaminase
LPRHDIIVIGASAGGVEALKELVSGLPPDFPVVMFVVLHIPAQSPSMLPSILSRFGALEAIHPEDGEAIQPGRIYVAPPNHHLLVKGGYVRIVRGPRENRHRPAADPLFRSAAHAYGPRVVGVVLTGTLDDGTAGLLAVKARGGVAIVQDPNEALYPGMPRSALENAEVDYCLRLSGIAARLVQLANEPVESEGAYAMPEGIEIESKIAQMEGSNMENVEKLGSPSVFTCPSATAHYGSWSIGKINAIFY